MNHLLASFWTNWFFHWGLSIFVWGAIFTLVGVLVGWFSWRNCQAEAERIEASNNRLKTEYKRVNKQLTELDTQISELEAAHS